ncbi:DUF1289 domain-containing protein [Pseudoxanthomonas japonensis]
MSRPSPCTDICQFDRKTDVCVGCFWTGQSSVDTQLPLCA